MTRDLFGRLRKSPRPRYEAALERLDTAANPVRAARVRWIREVLPTQHLALSYETYLVFEEAKTSFIYGLFTATVVLSAAFVEHWLSGALSALGHVKAANEGLANQIRAARKSGVAPDLVLDHAEALRLSRNPFVHLKDPLHDHLLSRKAFNRRELPLDVLESEAKNALIAMYGLVKHAR